MAIKSLWLVRQSKKQRQIKLCIARGQTASWATGCPKLAVVLPIYCRRFCSEALVAEILATAEILHTTMRAVVQRVSGARVIVAGSVTGEITNGLLILLGVGRNDTSATASGL